MQSGVVTPFDQTIRIFVLRSFVLLTVPLIIFTKSAWLNYDGIFDIFEILGVFLIIAGVLGRFWAILYIGGRKNLEVMQVGPYSICRHPLYLFSTIATTGFGLMLGSVVLTAVLAGGVFLILSKTAEREEAFLRFEFGDAYAQYAARVPRIWPKLSLFTTPEEHTFNAQVLWRNGRDALVFLCLIPIAEAAEYLHDTFQMPFFWVW